MSGGSLGQYFRSFLVKLNMVESQLGQMDFGGEQLTTNQQELPSIVPTDDVSFAIVLELKDGVAPSARDDKVRVAYLCM
jgi:mitotic spindle assembly checkpoint protein MAD2B